MDVSVDIERDAPDMLVRAPADTVAVEATTTNPPSGEEESTEDADGRRYWQPPGIEGHPFVLAVMMFPDRTALHFSVSAITTCLYRTGAHSPATIAGICESMEWLRHGHDGKVIEPACSRSRAQRS